MTRLKLTRKGWYRFSFSYLVGSIMWGTGQWVPDPRFPPNCKEVEIWVGPFATAKEATC